MPRRFPLVRLYIPLLYLACVGLCCSTAIGQTEKDSKPDPKPDSKSKFYDPVVRDVEGWTVKLDPELLTPEEQNRGAADAQGACQSSATSRIHLASQESGTAEADFDLGGA